MRGLVSSLNWLGTTYRWLEITYVVFQFPYGVSLLNRGWSMIMAPNFKHFLNVALFQKVFPSVICHFFVGWSQREKLLSEIKLSLLGNEYIFKNGTLHSD